MKKNKIIELCWLNWGWKTTVLRLLYDENYLEKEFLYSSSDYKDDFDKIYLKENRFFRVMKTLSCLFKNPKMVYYFLLFLIKTKNLFNSKIIIYITALAYFKYKYEKINLLFDKNIVFDEFVIHFLISISSNTTDKEKTKIYILNIIKYFDIYPIFFDTDKSISLERIIKRKRKNNDFDKISKSEKEKRKNNSCSIYKDILEEYSRNKNIPIIYLNWNLEINWKTKELKSILKNI